MKLDSTANLKINS